jgi:hypothetical protein
VLNIIERFFRPVVSGDDLTRRKDVNMKLNYVSVLKEYKTKNSAGGYFVRGEFNSQPSLLWFKYFKLLWVSTPAFWNLCPEPQLNKNEILLHIKDGDSIPDAVDALRSAVLKMNNQYIIPNENYNMEILDQGVI